MCDNCRLSRNTNQADLDKDGVGDVCDQDQDGDSKHSIPLCPYLIDHHCLAVVNAIDSCARIPNPLQKDTDKDGFGDVCDNCVLIPNNQVGVIL